MSLDTIECPYCCNLPDLRPGCQGCNGRGVVVDHGEAGLLPASPAPDPSSGEPS